MKYFSCLPGSWALVCDGTKALIFENRGTAALPNLILVTTWEAEEGAGSACEDRPGRVYESVGTARSSHEILDAREVEEHRFLDSIISQLDGLVERSDVEHLVVVAPPRALGHIRRNLTPQLRKRLKATLNHDLVHMSTPDIEARLARPR